MRRIRLKFCDIEINGSDVWTLFRDGTGCAASPHDTHHYAVIAHRSGNGDDLFGYTLHHEFFHSFCSEWFHDKPSPVLWALAHGKMLSGKEAAYEEIVSQAAHRWVLTNEQPIVGGVDWRGFKAKAKSLLWWTET